MKRFALFFIIALALAAAAPALASYETQNVFLCVMDGVRYSDTFGDPKHENIPHMWNDLRPQSAIYTNFRNTGVTVTRQGHSTLATGTWQTCPNGGPRMTMPSMFDYYRDQLGVPQPKTWAIFGKAAYSWECYSSFPAYRDKFKPSFQCGIGEGSIEDDNKVLARVTEVMDKDHPSLVFVNFGYTDHSGHLAVFEDYLKAIKNVDTIFYTIWQKIQSDPVYKDKTTLILVNDHGRHDDEHGGFKGHGDTCEGCRHIMLQILGPDIKKGVEIDREALQIDIAPTIGELLGFQTPLSKGEVISDCLTKFEAVNKKEAKTETTKQAVEMQKLAERDLVKVVAERLKATIKPEELQPGLTAEIVRAGLDAASGQKVGQSVSGKSATEALAARTDPYTPESAYYVVEAAAKNPEDEALAKESVFAVASLLGRIPECGGVTSDAGDSALILLTLNRAKRLAWWKAMPGKKQQKEGKVEFPEPVKSMTQPDLQRLARELGAPESKTPRQALIVAIDQKNKIGMPYSIDLLKYSVDAKGDIPSRDPRLAAGAFLLLLTQPPPGKPVGPVQMK